MGQGTHLYRIVLHRLLLLRPLPSHPVPTQALGSRRLLHPTIAPHRARCTYSDLWP